MEQEFISQIIVRIKESEERILKCLSLLTEDEIWFRQNKNSNSVGNLVLHLCGNIKQYVEHGLNGLTDLRNRDAEFVNEKQLNALELSEKFVATIKSAIKIISNLNQQDLLKQQTIQCFELTGIGILIHVTEHLSYHTGQITYCTKWIKNIDTEYYKGLYLN